jgi:hypothetical protein
MTTTTNPNQGPKLGLVAPIVCAHTFYGQYPVEIRRYAKSGKWLVCYGMMRRQFPPNDDLAAFEEFGRCLRHAAECAGMTDPYPVET